MKTTTQFKWILGLMIGTALGLGCPTAAADVPVPDNITWHTIDGGGTLMQDTAMLGFTLVGTVGQPDVGPLSGGAFEMVGGFWGEEDLTYCKTDFNNDGIVSPDDLDEFITTYFSDPPDRILADYNLDGMVSPDDLDEFITDYFAPCT